MAAQGPMSGFRDMLPDQMIPRNYMLATIQKVYEGYGFVPIQTPALERAETMDGKYGDEGDKLMYRFKDNGGRDVAMRYDMTVPLARFTKQYGSQLAMPFKRYVAGQVWRGESPQAGRYREFTQFDADIVGSDSPLADAEVVAMISDSMAALGAQARIRVNNRRILDALVEKAAISAGTDSPEGRQFVGILDKVDKVGMDAVLSEITDNFSAEAATVAGQYLAIDGTTADRLAAVEQLLAGSAAMEAGVANLRTVFALLEGGGYGTGRVVFDPTIARGLDYYTGIIYETTLVDAPELGSVCSGGRYDNLVRVLGGPDAPAVGMSIGVDRLYDGLQKLGLLPAARTTAQVLIANFDAADGPLYMGIANKLRAAGIATELSYASGKLVKQMKFADRQGIPYVVMVGQQEKERGIAKIRTMQSGDEAEVALDKIVEFITT